MKKIIFFNLLIIIIIFLSFEFLLRFLNLISLQGYEKNSFYEKNNIQYHSPNTVKKIMGKKMKTDKNGFRIPLTKFEYNNDLQSILVLGDSVSFGVGVEEKKTFIGILRNKLENNFYNASVTGYRLEDYLFLLKKYNKQFPEIKKYLIFICLNDIISESGLLREEKLKIISNNKNVLTKYFNKSFFIKINFYLRDKSTIFNLAKAVGTQNVKRHYNYITPYYDNKIILKSYENTLKKIINYSNLKKINVKFVLLPYKYQIKRKCDPDLMIPQKKIKRIFNKLNYSLFDFSQDFCNKDNNSKLILNFDPMHLSSSGHEFVSELLIKKGIIN